MPDLLVTFLTFVLSAWGALAIAIIRDERRKRREAEREAQSQWETELHATNSAHAAKLKLEQVERERDTLRSQLEAMQKVEHPLAAVPVWDGDREGSPTVGDLRRLAELLEDGSNG